MPNTFTPTAVLTQAHTTYSLSLSLSLALSISRSEAV